LKRLIIISLLLNSGPAYAKTFFLDHLLASNCISGNYSIANRNCTGGDGIAFQDLSSAIGALSGGDTLFIRAGTYTRSTGSSIVGALQIDFSGTAGKHTIVSGFESEQPVICPQDKTGKNYCLYNPFPGDTSHRICEGGESRGGAACFYPNPAISISGSHVDLRNMKTYGQLYIGKTGLHDVRIEKCDIGGGGPSLNQGSSLMLNTAGSPMYNITIRNNKLHHSAWGESTANGSTLMGYKFSAIIENNEFSDGWGDDLRYKDSRDAGAYETHIRYNIFKPSTINPSSNAGFSGINQYPHLDNVYVYQNIFLKKRYAVVLQSSAITKSVVYNNTFIGNVSDITSRNSGKWEIYNNFTYHSLLGNYTEKDIRRTSSKSDAPIGSPHARVSGAYITGNETIGTDW